MSDGEIHESDQQWARIFWLITGFLALFLVSLVWIRSNPPTVPGWEKLMSEYAAEEQSVSLRPFLNAVEIANREGVAGDPAFAQRAAQALSRAVALGRPEFPSLAGSGIETQRPDLPRLTNLFLMMANNADALMEGSRPEEAIQRLTELATVGTWFSQRPERSTLSHHLAGMAAMELAVTRLINAFDSGLIPAGERTRLAARLAYLESEKEPISAGVAGEMTRLGEAVLERQDDSEALTELVLYLHHELTPELAREKASGLVDDSLRFHQDLEAVMSEFLREAARPFPEQPVFNESWLNARTDNQLILDYFPAASELIIRDLALTARIRLLRMAADGEQAALSDPFSGQLIRRGDGVLYSIGPDGVDTGGAPAYQPANGIRSPGDIVIRMLE